MSLNKIRCFIIADDYKWHVLTDSAEEYLKYTKAYLELMSSSKKENTYYFRNIFLTTEEYAQILRNMSYHSGKVIELREHAKKNTSYLRLVE